MVSGFARPVGLHFLPDDRAAVDRALVTGRTLVETARRARSPVAIAELADAVAPVGRAEPGRRGASSGGEQQVEPADGEAIIATSSGS